MKAVLLSIKPKYCELIANGQKTIEVRKSVPKLKPPFKCYIYESKTFLTNTRYSYKTWARRGKVIGEFVCDCVHKVECGCYHLLSVAETMLNPLDIMDYADRKPVYGWHISNLKIYDKPKELSEFFIVDKKAVKECSLRERIYTNPDYTHGVCLPGTYICNKDPVDVDFCRGGCWKKSLTRPPQSWCYVEKIIYPN